MALLAYDDGDADVRGVDLYVTTCRLLKDPDAAGLAVAPADGAVHKSGWKVVCYGLVDLLVCAFLVWFEDYCDLKRSTESTVNLQDSINSEVEIKWIFTISILSFFNQIVTAGSSAETKDGWTSPSCSLLELLLLFDILLHSNIYHSSEEKIWCYFNLLQL